MRFAWELMRINARNIFIVHHNQLTFKEAFYLLDLISSEEILKCNSVFDFQDYIQIKFFVFLWRQQIFFYKYMSKRQKYPKEQPSKRAPPPKERCPQGWHCTELLKNRCNYAHDKDDRKTADKLSKVFEFKDTIIILDTSDSNLTPICLKDSSLLITLVNQKQFKMDIRKYYSAILLSDQKPYEIALKIEKQIGGFGEWEIEQKILFNHYPKQYDLHKAEKDTKMGEIKINGQLKKVITGHQGKKFYFQKVNKPCEYPLLNGCKVNYYLNGNFPKLTRINYPHEIKLCGIIQIDSNSQFYFISRNQEYDDMNPYNIPNELTEKLIQFKGLFPYSFLRVETLSQEKQTKINQILKEYLVKGRFKAWPHQSKYPIIELMDQVNIKNFKSLKEGIIYEAGISMTPFDKKQKEDSQKIVKKFKIEDYEKTRKIYDKQIYTVDGKSTKCHDDAVYIEPLKDGSFFVQIHIADVAALIQEDDELNKKLKKRDETIYIKNYYQPMLYDSLKNLLSLIEKQEKLAFTLSFEVNNEGFIDYQTVKFEKSIIVVQKNLSHQKLDSGSQEYPQLMELNKLFDRSRLIDNNYILQSETKSEVAISRLIFISSIIPTYLLEVNIERAKLFKESFEQYLKRMIEDRKKDMEKWENILDNIDKMRGQQSKINKEIKSIQKKVDMQLNKQRQIIIKRIKNEQKSLTPKLDKQKRPKKPKAAGVEDENESQFQSFDTEGEQVQLSQLVQQLADDLKNKEQIELQEEKDDELKHQKELKLKEKRAKALKQVNVSDLDSSQTQESEQRQSSSGDELQDEQFRFNAAVNGQKFMEKIFKNPIFNIDIKWINMDEINAAFKTILSKDKGKLYQQYFKRLQIMNRQHFKYIIKMQRDKRKQKEQSKKISDRRDNDRANDDHDTTQKNKRKYRRIDDLAQPSKQQQSKKEINQTQLKEKSEIICDLQNQNKKQTKNEAQHQNKQNKRNPKRMNEPQKKQLLPYLQQEFLKQKINSQTPKSKQKESQNTDSIKEKIPRKKQLLVKDLKIYMQNEKEKYIEKYEQQFEKDRKLSELDISFNEKDKEIIGSTELNEFKKLKIQRLKVILRQNQKNIKKNLEQKAKQIKNPSKKHQQKEKPIVKSQNTNKIDPQLYNKFKDIVESKKDYFLTKYQKPFCSGQKIEISEDQQWQQESAERKIQLKSAKFKCLLTLLMNNFKRSKNENVKDKKKMSKKQKKLLQKQQQKQSHATEDIKKQVEISKEKQIDISSSNSKQLKLDPVQKKIEIPTQEKIDESHKENAQKIIAQAPRSQQIAQNTQKLSKKALKKKIQQELEPVQRLINQKYHQQKEQLKRRVSSIKLTIKGEKQALYKQLQTANEQFNLLKLLTEEETSKKKEKKSKKQKKKADKKNSKQQKDHKSSVLTQFIQNFKDYAQCADFKFKQMKVSQLDSYLQKMMAMKKLCEDAKDSLEKMNREASKKGQNEDKLLKWNNPIRSYESLTVMRLIRSYKWLFEGQIYPSDIIKYHGDIKQIEKSLIELEDYRTQKMERGELKKNVKEANREISKLQFYNVLKRDENAVFTFLNIGSPCPEKVKFVYHSILQEVEVDNLEFKQDIYKEVKGRVKIVRDFPLKLRVRLQK